MRKKYVIVLFILLCLFSIPALWNKIETERSAKTVEFSVDYLSLLSLSEQSSKPDLFLNAMLLELKNEGFTTLTIPNNTFASLEERGLISVLSSDELGAIQLLSDNQTSFDRHLTYVLALDTKIEAELASMMMTRFPHHHIEQMHVNNHLLIGMDMPMTKLLNVSIPYMERDIAFLTEKPYEFSLVLKVDNKWQGNEEVALQQLNALSSAKISSIYFADAGVLGYPENHLDIMKALPDVPFAYKEYFASEEKQKGIELLAKERHYNMVRLHVVPNTLFLTHFEEPQVLVERITKAVTERNIRLFHLQFPWEMDEKTGKNIFVSSLSILKESKEMLLKKGYEIGSSQPFTEKESVWFTLSEWCAVFAGVLLIVSAVHSFLPKWSVLSFIVVTSIALSAMKFQVLPWQIVALLIAISVPLVVAEFILKRQIQKQSISLGSSAVLFVGFSLFSVIGGLLLSSMHGTVPHLLYFEPFRGVSLAHVAPPFLVFCLLLKWHGQLHKETLLHVASEPVRLYQVIALGVMGLVGAYYVSRTGNAGLLLPFEAEFRTLLENTLGVRPRTKEFLLAHPLMMVVLYYWHQHKWVKWGLPIAIVGQLSIVNTFTHFHTPVFISLQRGLYGILLGLLIGLLLIWCIETIKWLAKKKQMHESSLENKKE